MNENREMQKNPEENFTTVEVDTVTGEYYINLPEWVLNDFGWYEGTQVNMEVDGDCIVITEIKEGN
jgi:bifunctional DNA-binding transcriptional regulator/antitoxin component of YhaV-PrlF toxin-antitoxin module